jgi:hypothetical protein
MEITVSRTDDGCEVCVSIPGDREDELLQLHMTPEMARTVAFAIVDVSDDIDPPAWRKLMVGLG